MYYVSPIVTTKKIPKENTQKKTRNKSKHVTIKKINKTRKRWQEKSDKKA